MAQEHIRALIDQTKGSTKLSENEKQALMGSLGRLTRESIGQAGRKLSQERLGTRRYSGLSASDYFAHCYDIRSRLAHGEANAELQRETEITVATLEVFVSDLLSVPMDLDHD